MNGCADPAPPGVSDDEIDDGDPPTAPVAGCDTLGFPSDAACDPPGAPLCDPPCDTAPCCAPPREPEGTRVPVLAGTRIAGGWGTGRGADGWLVE